MLNRIYSSLLLVLLTVSSAWAQTSSADALKYVTQGAQVHQVYSKIVGQQYQLMVSLPQGYNSKSKRKYPTVYVLDGQWDFTLVRDIHGKLNYDKATPAAIIVGITWGGEGAKPQQLRALDFLPSKNDVKGAKLFLQAIDKEIIPFIESTFKANDKRVLTGSSFGGVFTTYAMLEQPSLFKSYIVLAPAYHGFPKMLLHNKLKQFPSTLGDTKLSLYIGCGRRDGCRRDSKKLYDRIEKLNLKGVRSKYTIFDDIGHAGISGPGNTYGLIFSL